MTPREWAARIRALPFLMEEADRRAREEGGGGDRYDWMAKLREEREAKGEPYVWTVIYRRPPSKCHTGEHEIPAHTHEVIRPGGGGIARLLISERELHDLEHHDRKLVDAQLRKLEAIFPD